MKNPLRLHSPLWLESARDHAATVQRRHRIASRLLLALYLTITAAVTAWLLAQ